EGGDPRDNLGDGGSASAATLWNPAGLTLTPDGSLVIADTGNHRLRVVEDGYIHTLSGSTYKTWMIDGEGGNPNDDLGDQGAVIDATFAAPSAVFADAAGNLFVTDSELTRVRQVFSSGLPENTPT